MMKNYILFQKLSKAIFAIWIALCALWPSTGTAQVVQQELMMLFFIVCSKSIHLFLIIAVLFQMGFFLLVRKEHSPRVFDNFRSTPLIKNCFFLQKPFFFVKKILHLQLNLCEVNIA